MDFYNTHMVIGADVSIKALIDNLNQVLIPGNGQIFVSSNDGTMFVNT